LIAKETILKEIRNNSLSVSYFKGDELVEKLANAVVVIMS